MPTLTAALEIAQSKTADVSKEIAVLKRYTRIEELTREAVTNLVQVIYISEPTKNGKEKGYDIEIEYRFNNLRGLTWEMCLGLSDNEEDVI